VGFVEINFFTMLADSQLNLLISFILRPAMYVGTADRSRIVGFIIGFESAANNIDFTTKLKDKLHKVYGINQDLINWENQLEKYSLKAGLTWETAFLLISIEVIYDQVSDVELENLNNQMRKKIIGLVLAFEYNQHISRFENWLEVWKTFVNIRKEWFLAIWDKEDVAHFRKLDKSIKTAYSFSDYTKQVDDFNSFYEKMKIKYKHLYPQEL
jgi:hypothetical protein